MDRPRRILVVEDNVDARLTLHELLESWGHQVEVAHDGLEGVTKALQRRVELAVVDIGLPGLDGYEVAQRLRELPALRTTLIVALSGYAQAYDRVRTQAAQFDLYMVKPADPQALVDKIAHLQRNRDAFAPVPPVAALGPH
jgi:CheY-like chemotaxis protein